MKLVSHYMQQITDVEIYPIISLIIFMSIFILVLYRVIKADKKFIEEASNIPLEDDNPSNIDNNSNKQL